MSTNYKVLFQRAQFLNLLGRDLERISSQQDSTRVVRYVLRKLGEALGADFVIQMDVRRTDGAFERPFALALTPKGEKALSRREPAGKTPAGNTPAGSTAAGKTAAGKTPAGKTAAGDAPAGTPPAAESLASLCREFLRRPVSPPDPELLLLRINMEDRPAAVLGFRRIGKRYSRVEARFGQDAAEILSENLGHRERERAQDLKERIYAKVLSERRSEDVLYQILHGLKRLLQYDHGASVLLLKPDGKELCVQAEIISWTKAKSSRIGQSFPVTEELRMWLEHLARPVLLRAGDKDEAAAVPEILRGPLTQELEGVPPVRCIVLATLRHRHRPMGVLKIRSRSAAAFTPVDLRTLSEFLPLASVTLYNSTLYKMQHDLLVSAERKTALADLARAISHDLNNAFGVMIPLLQTLRRDLTAGINPARVTQDLEVIERYAHSSSRIFQGLLTVAQGEVEPARWGNVNSILETILRMLGPNLESKGIRVEREMAESLPKIFFRGGEIEQIFLNLIYNARDAMSRGDRLTIRSRVEGKGVQVDVIDTGKGIPEGIRGRIFEPFFTTKSTGSGLGLDITRSLVWDYDGRLTLEPNPEGGTRASVWLPRVAERLRPEAEKSSPGSVPQADAAEGAERRPARSAGMEPGAEPSASAGKQP